MPNTDWEPIDCDTARSLHDLRHSQQLSSDYTILGDIPLYANTPSAIQPSNSGPLTRIMTWNAGGRAGSLDSPDKLSIVCLTMLCQGRSGQVRFITRPKSRTMRAKRKKTFES